jgi:hypothetical protein
MDIKKYVDWFHDGNLKKISNFKDQLIIEMSSAQVDLDEIEDCIKLSKNKTISGKLYLDGVEKIIVNDKAYKGVLKKKYDEGQILDFEINNKNVELGILWFVPGVKKTDFTTIIIYAKKIWWENIPNLYDHFD